LYIQNCEAGLDFVCGELIGRSWFAIGRCHVSDRVSLTPINTSSEKIRRVAARGTGSYFDNLFYKKYSINNNCPF